MQHLGAAHIELNGSKNGDKHQRGNSVEHHHRHCLYDVGVNLHST